MSWLGRAALFAIKELAKPALEQLGEKIGAAVGTRMGRRIDPAGVKQAKDDEDEDDEDDTPDEDERTP